MGFFSEGMGLIDDQMRWRFENDGVGDKDGDLSLGV